MKLRHKLALTFGLLTLTILTAFGLTVYYFESEHRKSEFFNRLRSRVEITEKMVLEKNSFTPEAYEKIREQFLNKLPEETEEVVPMTSGWHRQLNVSCPDDFLQKLEVEEEAFFSERNRQGAGRVFHLEGGNYVVIITATDQSGLELLSNLKRLLITALGIAGLLTFFASYVFSKAILRPVSDTIREANAISASNLNYRLPVSDKDDELGQLALAFNGMLERIEQTFQAQRRFVSDASHEIRNPLTSILGEAELALEKERTASEYRQALSQIYQEADRLNRLVNSLLQLSAITGSSVDLRKERLPVSELIHEAIGIYSRQHPEFQFSFHAEHSAFVQVNRNLMVNALLNLLDNAWKFSGGSEVRISSGIAPEDKQMVRIGISDSGLGIPEQDMQRIRQPFFRSENVRQIPGTGIGIPLTMRIVELHGGNLIIESVLHKGTTASILLPAIP
ncbi:MAG: HAMP domain-containing histidine kinase [Cyclobacteriaceae bacterium]|nr:HAMP domain-containing histidine kinase [Cyclobacteriaceae bacterium]MCX7638253.1 HAMP domain-containing histidine kinase [Cyclobacteriaceae bacterium]MDW8331515.1 histidine kinase dimerization/phospho-acceptor domain-containing protein [Cyclobacteriaceae bacterium]